MHWIARLAGLPALWNGIDKKDLHPNPFKQFDAWYRLARRVRLPMPNAMTLSTVSPDGQPAGRVVLLKQADARGFVFYTNYESNKARDLAANPKAALTFYWPGLERQVRLAGRVEKADEAESDAYFASRPRGSRLGAWASRQSHPVPDRHTLEAAYEEQEKMHAGNKVPRPPFWGGYRLIPDRMEFWQGRAYRLHDRFVYEHDKGGWRLSRLSP